MEDEDRKAMVNQESVREFTSLHYCVDVQDLKTIQCAVSNETKMVVMGLDSSLY